MGNFKEHVLFGFLTAAVSMYLLKEIISLNLLELYLGLLSVFVGSIIPDIDHKNSYVHRSVKSFTSILCGVLTVVISPFNIYLSYFAGIISFLSVYTCFSMVKIKHRGFTHTITFCILLASITVILGVYIVQSIIPGLAMGIGVFSHLMLDREFKF